GNQFLDIVLDILEISVLASLLHGLDRTHSPIGFELAPFEDDGFPWGFLGTGQEGTQHDRIGTGCEGLGNVPGISYPSVSYDGDPPSLNGRGNFQDRRKLATTDPCNHSGGTD